MLTELLRLHDDPYRSIGDEHLLQISLEDPQNSVSSRRFSLELMLFALVVQVCLACLPISKAFMLPSLKRLYFSAQSFNNEDFTHAM